MHDPQRTHHRTATSGWTLPILALTAGTLLITGCVSKKDHEALQQKFDETRAALEGTVAERDRQITDLSEALANEEAKLADAEARIAALEADRAALESELQQMEAAKVGAEEELAEALASRSKLKASLEDLKRALLELNERKAKADARIAEFKKMLTRFKPLIDAGKLNVKIIDGRMVLVLPTDILFASASARLSKDGEQAITEVGKVLATIKDREFQVEGHTDNDPIRTKNYKNNWELAADRALNVLKTLLAAGVKPENISAASYGEFKPAASNKTKEGKAKNRRIEIIVVPDLSDLPGFDELKKMGGQS